MRRIELDTTFVSPLQEAIIYEQMGRCGAYVGDYSQAEEFLQRALYLFEDLKQKEAAIRIRDRLAWLFQLNKQWERAVPYYHQIVSWNERMGRWDNVERAYRNIAFCYHMMSEPEDAIKYAKKAEKVIEREKYQIKPTRMSYPRVGLFGLTVTVPIFGIRPIGAASSEGLSKAEKATLIFGLTWHF